MMKPFIISLFLINSLAPQALIAQAESDQTTTGPIQFRMKTIAFESYESAGVFDVDGNDTLDIISGAFWYEGPDFINRHFIKEVERFAGGQYYDDFSNIPLDINGDGRLDYVTGSWESGNLRWLENPGKDGEWKEYVIDTTGPVECTRGWDIDGDGQIEIVPNNPGHALKFYKLQKDAQGKPLGKFTRIDVAGKQGHGLGFGDINGDGRGDLIVSDGWLEAPQNPLKGKWKTHQEFSLGTASVPILVVDVNGDGTNDLIVGQGHGYGLDWYEQTTDPSGKRSWAKHPIDPDNAQYHAMEWADLDGDQQPELITGKRYRAHNGHDPGTNDPLGLYYFTWNGNAFTKHTIAYGPLGTGKGTGLYFTVADLDGNGRKDIVVAGKDGLCVFFNGDSR